MTRRPDAQRLLKNLRALGVARPERLPKIPQGLRDYIAGLIPARIREIKQDAQELERLGIIPESNPPK